MSKHFADISWALEDGEDFLNNRYSRSHNSSIDGSANVAASSSPHIVPLPFSVRAKHTQELF